MATLSISILLLLQLLLVATAAPLDDICAKTNLPSSCKDILITFDTRSATASLRVLGEIAIDAATGLTRQVRNRAHELVGSSKDPNQKRVYANCEKLFDGGANALVNARRNIKTGQAAAAAVARAIGGCKAADGGLKKISRDAGVIAQAVGLIAKNLQ